MSEQKASAEPAQSTLSDADIARIATIVAAVLKAQPVDAGLDVRELGKVISDGINAAAPPRHLTIGEYLRQNTRKAKLNRRSYVENGRPLPEHLLGDSLEDTEFIDLLNRVTRSGLYFDGKVTVLFEQQPGGHAIVNIAWSNATIDQRTDMMKYFYSVKEAWRQIVTIQEAEAKEEAEIKRLNDERKAPKRELSFGAQRQIQADAAARRAEANA